MNADKSKTRAPKGTVSLQELTHTRRFKYRCNKQIFYITLPSKGVLSPILEELVGKIIEWDTATNCHDNTQEKYRQMLRTGKI